MNDLTPDVVLVASDLLARLGGAWPRLTAFLSLLLLALAVIGLLCAQIDPASLRSLGYPRAAVWVERGARWGAFAVALYKSRRGKP
jgi:hypothetical protein